MTIKFTKKPFLYLGNYIYLVVKNILNKLYFFSCDKMNNINIEPSLNWDRIEDTLSESVKQRNQKYTKNVWYLFLIQKDDTIGHLCLIKYE